MIKIRHAVDRDDLIAGVVYAECVEVGPSPGSLVTALDEMVSARRAPLDVDTEARRKAARDILRNGAYKPTGRGKPASEYLLRAAQGEEFPRINGPVDANNLVSLRYMVPISVCDVDLAGCSDFELRLGGEDERYVFNATGQTLDLRDLVCVCALAEASTPIINPIKDSMATKLRAETRRVLGVVYFPAQVGGEALAREATSALAHWLLACGEGASVVDGLLLPKAELTL